MSAPQPSDAPFDVTSVNWSKSMILTWERADLSTEPVSSIERRKRSNSRQSRQSFALTAAFNNRTASSLSWLSCSRLWRTRRYEPAVLRRCVVRHVYGHESTDRTNTVVLNELASKSVFGLPTKLNNRRHLVGSVLRAHPTTTSRAASK